MPLARRMQHFLGWLDADSKTIKYLSLLDMRWKPPEYK
jgi:hypothetical protein